MKSEFHLTKKILPILIFVFSILFFGIQFKNIVTPTTQDILEKNSVRNLSVVNIPSASIVNHDLSSGYITMSSDVDNIEIIFASSLFDENVSYSEVESDGNISFIERDFFINNLQNNNIKSLTIQYETSNGLYDPIKIRNILMISYE